MSYWRTLRGLISRISDLAHDFTWRTLNASLKEIFLAQDEAQKIRWVNMGDDRVCPICMENEGEYDVDEPFLPELPAHVMCRCYWSSQS